MLNGDDTQLWQIPRDRHSMMGYILCVHEGVKRGPYRDGGIMRRWLWHQPIAPSMLQKVRLLLWGRESEL